ncbi:hypothetical protein Tco_0151724 [Tanacetum coccineum]
MVAFLEKPTESDGFHEIIDFLNANQIHYALTVNPTIYTSCIEQFWATAKVKTVNGERQIQALVDKKKVIITETSIRSDLHLEDADGTDCLPTATIFEELARMGTYLKLCRAYELCDKNEQLHVFDSEDTLKDAEKSQLKMNEFQKDEKVQELKIKPIDYTKLNKLYDDFVPQKELSAEQTYFPSSFISSEKVSSETKPSMASMPSANPML